MTLQNDVQEIKKVYSDSFHATKPLHSVPATLHGWDNLLTIVELLAEWQGRLEHILSYAEDKAWSSEDGELKWPSVIMSILLDGTPSILS